MLVRNSGPPAGLSPKGTTSERLMGQVINGPWITAPARVSAKLYALPEQDDDRLYIMPRVVVPRRSAGQEPSQDS